MELADGHENPIDVHDPFWGILRPLETNNIDTVQFLLLAKACTAYAQKFDEPRSQALLLTAVRCSDARVVEIALQATNEDAKTNAGESVLCSIIEYIIQSEPIDPIAPLGWAHSTSTLLVAAEAANSDDWGVCRARGGPRG